jgi:hypothetical protein
MRPKLAPEAGRNVRQQICVVTGEVVPTLRIELRTFRLRIECTTAVLRRLTKSKACGGDIRKP